MYGHTSSFDQILVCFGILGILKFFLLDLLSLYELHLSTTTFCVSFKVFYSVLLFLCYCNMCLLSKEDLGSLRGQAAWKETYLLRKPHCQIVKEPGF